MQHRTVNEQITASCAASDLAQHQLHPKAPKPKRLYPKPYPSQLLETGQTCPQEADDDIHSHPEGIIPSLAWLYLQTKRWLPDAHERTPHSFNELDGRDFPQPYAPN